MPGGVMTDGARSVAANATTANIMAGKTLEFIAEAAIVSIYIVAAATGIFATVVLGGEIVVDDQEVSDANRWPRLSEDLLARVGGSPGERIVVRLRNSTGAAIIVDSLVEVLPI